MKKLLFIFLALMLNACIAPHNSNGYGNGNYQQPYNNRNYQQPNYQQSPRNHSERYEGNEHGNRNSSQRYNNYGGNNGQYNNRGRGRDRD
jgi:hypothetical protein